MIAVAGCVAQAEGREIMARAPVVDIVVGPQSYHRLADLVAEARATGQGVIATEFPAEDKFAHLPERPKAKVKPSAFVTAQEGCDKFCTFCVVPYTRGAEFSRSPAAIIAEVQRLLHAARARSRCSGRTSTPITGPMTRGRAWSLASLLKRLASVPGIERLRFTTSHPRDMDDESDRAVRR